MNLLVDLLEPEDFWTIIDELAQEKKDDPYESLFYDNRESLLVSYCIGNMYGITDNDKLLPAFCVKHDDGEAVMIWVHKKYRRRGIATEFINQLNITKATDFLPGSEPFWKSLSKNDKNKNNYHE